MLVICELVIIKYLNFGKFKCKVLTRDTYIINKYIHICVKFSKEISIEISHLVIIKVEVTLKSNLVTSSQHTHVMFI